MTAKLAARASGLEPEVEVLADDILLTPAQKDQVDQAVRTLNGLAQRTRQELAVQVSRYVLDEFFGGDWDKFCDPRRNKSVSFRALAERQDLVFARTTLLALIHVGRQIATLPGQVAAALSVEHHRILLTLPTQQAREEMAKLAAEHHLTRAELKSAVAQQLPARPAAPEPKIKMLAHGRLVSAESSLRKGVTVARVERELRHWSPAERARFAAKVEAVRQWADEVGAVLAQAPAAGPGDGETTK